jgi:hypothetical protein
MQEVEGRRSEAEGGEDHSGMNDPVLLRADHGDGQRAWTQPHGRE